MAQLVKNPSVMWETWVGKSLEKVWQPTPVFLPGESHGQRSLAGYSPWGHKESDATERLTPLKWYSCLDNLRDSGAWWAAVSGVAQSQTQLKRLGHNEDILYNKIIAFIL